MERAGLADGISAPTASRSVKNIGGEEYTPPAIPSAGETTAKEAPTMRIRDLNWHNGIPRFFVIRERCPLCRATEFNLSANHPLKDVLRRIAIRPVRCSNCWRRFYWLRSGSR